VSHRFNRLIARIGAVAAGTAVALSAALATAPAAHAVVRCAGCTAQYQPDYAMVFTREANGHFQVFKATQNLSTVTQLTNGPTDSVSPSINAAQTKIAYTSFGTSKTAVFTMNADGTNQRNITNDASHNYQEPKISPDGTKVVVVSDRAGGSELFVIDLTTGAQKQLTFWGEAEGSNWSPAWSPNGQYIAFTSSRARLWNIWLMPATGGSAQKVTYDGDAGGATWSPDGQRIAYNFKEPGTSTWEIYYSQAFETNVTVKVSTSDGTAHLAPTWAPDGSAIAYSAKDNAGSHLKVSPLNGAAAYSVIGTGDSANWGFPSQQSMAYSG